jgi:hypothetical protein
MIGGRTGSSALFPDAEGLATRLAADGYPFLRGIHDISQVLAARAEAFGRLEAVGEIAPPAVDGIATGASRREEAVADLGARGNRFRRVRVCAVSHGPRIRETMGTVVSQPMHAQDYMFLRPAPVGRSTGPHCGYPFFARAIEAVFTVWTAFGPVPISDGPLAVVEGSHRFADLVEATRGFGVARDSAHKAGPAEDQVSFAHARGRVRLSTDVRFQLVGAPQGPRYFGPNPGGTTGAGYGELNRAKPLTGPWHIR